METKAKIIEKALSEGRSVLSEHESKEFLRTCGIPVTREIEVRDHKALGDALIRIGYPMVIKGSSPHLAHKSEQGLVKVDIRNDQEAEAAFQEIMSRMGDGEKAVLVQEMVRGSRELMVGMTRDPQFGPCVMFGLGGVFTEILKDVAFRVAPLEKRDAMEMTQEIRARRILDAIRGLPAADVDQLCEILIRVGEIGIEHEAIKELDINPLILSGSKPIAVDALIVLSSGT